MPRISTALRTQQTVERAVNERQQVYKSSRLLGALYSSIPTP